MWHLATHPHDRRRLVAEPALMPTAIEEFLRAYAPVTMARRLIEDKEYMGCPMKAGERVLMNFPAANRDPEVFPDADTVILDRQQNRHLAFGHGIHFCLGAPLARMEAQLAINLLLQRLPGLRLAGFVDAGWLSNNNPNGTSKPSSDRLAGLGLGLRYGNGPVSITADYGRLVRGRNVPLTINTGSPQKGDEKLYLNMSVRF